MAKIIAVLVTLCLLVAAVDIFYHQKTSQQLPLVKVRTEFGEMTLELWPHIAPKHVEQFLKLVDAGVYNRSRINRIEKNFIVYFAGSYDRPEPLTPEQESVIQSIPLEARSGMKHTRGILSMARYDDPNSAMTSFSILLGAAPHLDGQYTIFGRMVAGESTLEKLENLETDNLNAPTQPTIIESMSQKK